MIQLVVFQIDFTDEGLRRNPALTNGIKDDRWTRLMSSIHALAQFVVTDHIDNCTVARKTITLSAYLVQQ